MKKPAKSQAEYLAMHKDAIEAADAALRAQWAAQPETFRSITDIVDFEMIDPQVDGEFATLCLMMALDEIIIADVERFKAMTAAEIDEVGRWVCYRHAQANDNAMRWFEIAQPPFSYGFLLDGHRAFRLGMEV